MNIYYMVAQLYPTCDNKNELVERVIERYPFENAENVYHMVEAIDAYFDLTNPTAETDNV